MWTLIQFGRLLSLVVWVGGIAFFAFVVAPVAFGRLGSAHEAGLVVGGTLRVLHLLGLGCSAVFLGLTLTRVGRGPSRRLLLAECGLVLAMALLTSYSQFGVLPRMEAYRAEAGGDVGAVDATQPARVEFERLHRRSERVEGAVLFGGLTVLAMVAGEGRGPGAVGRGPLES